ncbi:MAG: biotin--[acetyl-CoA-carboxylase] ligase [Methylacidiphilales bacterium]|nr:biotin--[acetyl-CoA-carboxylase] ligase [Candidatus Methylacidiphilales bacterium]
MNSPHRQEASLLGALFSGRGQRVSRAELARLAQIPSAELETRLAPYLDAGYPIEFHPQGGVSLREPSDIWSAEEILGRCPGLPEGPAWDPLLLAETASTNDVARDQARRGARAGFVVAAGCQTRGRGRMGRAWESPPERGLYVSILLRPDFPIAQVGRLTSLASVAAVDAVETLSGLRPRIKWPNDLLLDGKKLAGLLIETEPAGPRIAFAVIGIGINLRHAAADFSPEIRPLATSLYLVTGRLFRRADLLVSLLQAMEHRLKEPFDSVREAWAASSLNLGQQVTLTTARGEKHGQVLGLDESGALLLRAPSGEIEIITAGDMRAV